MHTLFGYSLSTQCSFDCTKNMIGCYRGKDCMKRFCKDLKEHAAKIIKYEKKEMIPLTDEENKSYEKQKFVIYTKKDLVLMMTVKKYNKLRDHCDYTGKYRGAAYDICNLRYKAPKEISVVFYNGSTDDYHFIIKELAKEFNGQFECLGEDTEKYMTFSVPIKKELDYGKSVKYKIKFIDSFRFMSTSLSKLVRYLSEKLHSNKCTDTDCKSHLHFISIKGDQLIFRCFECKKNYKKDFKKELIKGFEDTHKFCNGDINKFFLLLRKGVYPYENIDSWERFDETSLSDKKAFHSNLNIKDITDVD